MQRVNLDLKKIADNKAKMMVSLNSILFAIMIPVILTFLDEIRNQDLFFSIGVLFLTSLITLVYSVTVLRPFDWQGKVRGRGPDMVVSPFMYYNFAKKDFPDYVTEMGAASTSKKLFKEIVMTDLYMEGCMLGNKYVKLRRCYNIYLGGLALAVGSAILIILTKI